MKLKSPTGIAARANVNAPTDLDNNQFGVTGPIVRVAPSAQAPNAVALESKRPDDPIARRHRNSEAKEPGSTLLRALRDRP
jgi:hypothetical protein